VNKEGNLSPSVFRNIVFVGLAVKEYEYVKKFIKDYESLLRGDTGKDMVEISYAMLYYETRDFDAAMSHLSSIVYSHPALRLDAKHLYSKIYYDSGDFISLDSLVDAYKHYLKNDKQILRKTAEFHNVYLKYLGKLARIKSSQTGDETISLKKQIDDNLNMDFRHKMWLRSKIDELLESA
jgi:hypothetical protein